ncbi:nitrate reductase molybdenum cofactor assembly chaperone [Vibrio algicola]|uniref:Nitrate reductase molybdenum cofactor assembly chaperone n=1 Tax=Vibrio algicola TaxID=2662262 RepID=A0A5Q0TLJ7_9VIBR|nr:nitrate reductase molybdenum cofactor assembly chaperone [Vibrio algicola]
MKDISEMLFLSPAQMSRLYTFIEELTEQDLLDAQSNYIELFDRGRSLSLLLFEHVHGESRDRGQAMIDLMEQYKTAGLQIESIELPDYLPVFLEYLATLAREEAVQGLADIAPILALLGARLEKRDSLYSSLFTLLLELSGTQVRPEHLHDNVDKEQRDDTAEALDAVWEEEQIKFLGEEGCASAEQNMHQKSFAGSVQPQYVSLDSIAPLSDNSAKDSLTSMSGGQQ